MDCMCQILTVVLIVNVLLFLGLGIFVWQWLSRSFKNTSEMLESLKLESSNRTIDELKRDIEHLRRTCHGERTAHRDVMDLLDDGSALRLVDPPPPGYRQNSTVSYYKVTVEGCDLSIELIALNNLVVVVTTLILLRICKVVQCKGCLILKHHIKNTNCCGLKKEDQVEISQYPQHAVVL